MQYKRKSDAQLLVSGITLLLDVINDIPYDIYYRRGINSSHVPERNKKILMRKLMDEFLPN